MNNKKLFIACELLIATVFIVCYWGFGLDTLFSLLVCLPVAAFSIYLLISRSKAETDPTDHTH